MLDFVRKAFRGGLEVILWINVILASIVGGVGGYYLGQLISYQNADGFAFGGVIIGLLCGILGNIVMGGLISTIINIDENIEKLIDPEGVKKATLELKTLGKFIVKSITGSDGIGLRKEPSPKMDSFAKVANGTEVTLREIGKKCWLDGKSGDWYKIETNDGNTGWCFSGSLEKI